MTSRLPIVAIIGPTCVGKTKLGITLAKAANGEIISLDSIQLYKENKIMAGTVTQQEMQGIRHHLIDCLEANEEPLNFVCSAISAIESIRQRGKLPIIVGGSMSLVEPLFSHYFMEQQQDVFAILLKPHMHALMHRTDARIDTMVYQGLFQEVQTLYELEQFHRPKDFTTQGIWKSIGYPELRQCCDVSDAQVKSGLFGFGIETMKLNARSYACRQLEWMADRLLPILFNRRWNILIINVGFVQAFEDEVERPTLAQLKNWMQRYKHSKWTSTYQFGRKHLIDDEF